MVNSIVHILESTSSMLGTSTAGASMNTWESETKSSPRSGLVQTSEISDWTKQAK